MTSADEVLAAELWLARARDASTRGDSLRAIDAAARGLAQHPDSLPLLYQQLLAFARVGAGRRTREELDRLEAEGRLAAISDARLTIDFLVLKGRVLKDSAMRAESADERALWASRAAEAYGRVFVERGGGFAAINAATLWRVAGDVKQSERMAQEALARLGQETDAYWRLAIEGEALCLLGDETGAARAFAEAYTAANGRLQDVATTRRQLDWLSRSVGIGGAALAALPAPRVLHWLAAPQTNAALVERVSWPDASFGLIAFGSLLSGSDCAVAEALARAGGEINLVLPCSADLCRASLVAREGALVGDRFDRIVAAASNLAAVTLEGDPCEPTVLRLAVEQARGQAFIRAAALSTGVETLHVPHAQTLDSAEAQDLSARAAAWPRMGEGDAVWSRRVARALVFGDVKGFSGISEALHPAFFETVLGGFAEAIAGFGAKVEYGETAGDGVYFVVSDVVAAVSVCRALQASLDPRRLHEAGLPPLALRLSAHFGPVFPGRDPVTGRDKFFGREVVRTARIEPVTPPGETYVTEQFAAQLAYAAADNFTCEYVGQQTMAKGFGACRMYALARRAPFRAR